MKRTIAAIGGLALLSGGGMALSRDLDTAGDRPQSAAESAAASISRGATAWAENCGACHNLRSPAELDDVQWRTAAYHMRVRANLPGQMVRDIIAFLQASNGRQSPAASVAPAGSPSSNNANAVATSAMAANTVASTGAASAAIAPDPVAGGEIYTQTCVACHGADGSGAIPGVPDFRESNGRLSKSDDVLINNMINGFQTPGSPMPMPARGGNPALTEQDMADVLAYMRLTFEQ